MLVRLVGRTCSTARIRARVWARWLSSSAGATRPSKACMPARLSENHGYYLNVAMMDLFAGSTARPARTQGT
jgi:hypothetical protein